MNKTYYQGFVRNCLNELAEIDQQINLLDPVVDKDKIAYLREESLKVQLRADAFCRRTLVI
jgi:hypothetical protein